MAIESGLQSWLHALEQGRFAKWIVRGLASLVLLLLAAFWLAVKFNGFSLAEAMDQAQIGRQIATGQGYTTLYARPLAINVLAGTGRLRAPLPELSNAPLGPFLNAAAFRASGMDFTVSGARYVSTADLAVAGMGLALLLASLLVAYMLGRALFEARLALIGTGLLACTALLWRFSTSGLPQIAMLFLFNSSLLFLVFALHATDEGKRTRALVCAWLAALLLGLTTLGHGIMLWTLPGLLLPVAATLRPRVTAVAGCLAAYVLPLAPWMWHNWRASGNPLGLAYFEMRRPAGMEKLAFAADLEPDLAMHWADLSANAATQAVTQLEDFFGFFGYNLVAPAFFLAVIFYTFNRWQAAQLRWAVLLMWAGAFAGMSVAGVEGTVSANQLHVLFLPVFVFYGLGFLLVMWQRLGFEQPLLRFIFIAVVYAAVSGPLLGTLGARTLRANWPPYLPPVIQKLGEWITPGEALGSDVPWATAWYAARTSLLLPESVAQFELVDGERLLGAPLVAVYLTPASGGSRTYTDIVTGRYSDWARLVLREAGTLDADKWPYRHRLVLPIEGGALLFADRPRWQK